MKLSLLLTSLIALSLTACGDGGLCVAQTDHKVRRLAMNECLNQSASIITENTSSRSEAHETVEECRKYAYEVSVYSSCVGKRDDSLRVEDFEEDG